MLLQIMLLLSHPENSGFSCGTMIKNLPANAGDTRDSGWEDPLECGMATHFSMLAWKIPWTEEPGGQLFPGSQRVGHD